MEKSMNKVGGWEETPKSKERQLQPAALWRQMWSPPQFPQNSQAAVCWQVNADIPTTKYDEKESHNADHFMVVGHMTCSKQMRKKGKMRQNKAFKLTQKAEPVIPKSKAQNPASKLMTKLKQCGDGTLPK